MIDPSRRLRILQAISEPDSSRPAAREPWSYRGHDWATDGTILLRMNGPCCAPPFRGPGARNVWSVVQQIFRCRRRPIRIMPLPELRKYLTSIDRDEYGAAPIGVGDSVVNAQLILRGLRGLKAKAVAVRAPLKPLDSIQVAAMDGEWDLYVMPMARTKPRKRMRRTV